MRITVFTCNQPRHLSLVRRLAERFDEVYAVLECNTVFPGQVADFFKKSPVMQDYFARVVASEKRVFGDIGLLPSNVRVIALKMGDVSMVPIEVLKPVLESDAYVVFGASYIKGDLIDALVARNAINIHMGVSPYYRGSSCNFWAMYDGRPEYVGATIHKLSKGLDSGAMLFHAFPASQDAEPFDYGMHCVRAAHEALVDSLADGTAQTMIPVLQDRNLEMRYTRNADFNDDVAAEYLARLPNRVPAFDRDITQFLSPVFC